MFPNLFSIKTLIIGPKIYALQWAASSYGVGSTGRVNMFSFNHFSLSIDPSVHSLGEQHLYILRTFVPNHNMLGQ